MRKDVETHMMSPTSDLDDDKPPIDSADVSVMLQEEIKKSYKHAEKQDAKYLQNMEKYRSRVHELNLTSKQKLT